MRERSRWFGRALVAGSFALLASSGSVACSSDSDSDVPEGCTSDNPNCKSISTSSSGAEAVEKRRCHNCHDSSKGIMAGATTPLSTSDPKVELYPPNLTPDDATGIGLWTDDQLATAIRTGIDRDSLQLCPQMDHAADMSDFEVYSIISYLRSLPPVKNEVLRSVCPPLKTKDEQR